MTHRLINSQGFALVPEGKRLFVLNLLLAESLEEAQAQTQARRSWVDQIRTLQENGRIRVNVWSRDCDCAEGWHTYVVPVSELESRIQSDLEWADGAMSHSLARPSHEPDLPRTRDRVLEAFEDGHAWSV